MGISEFVLYPISLETSCFLERLLCKVSVRTENKNIAVYVREIRGNDLKTVSMCIFEM